MSYRRVLLVRIALVLLVAVPLRVFAAIGGCESSSPDRPAMHAMDDSHRSMPQPMDHGTGGEHGTCSVCCCAAVIASGDFRWPARPEPRVAQPSLVPVAIPAVIPDRLERPPRTFFA
jgi:hypothetical protein